MNDQYKHVEKTLTPGIAVDLIQELFSGQSVQKQEIVRAVDETHLERDGRPPISIFHHPVTMALSKMKRKGQADNPRYGHWSILSTTQEEGSVDSDQNNLDSANVEPEKIIGSG